MKLSSSGLVTSLLLLLLLMTLFLFVVESRSTQRERPARQRHNNRLATTSQPYDDIELTSSTVTSSRRMRGGSRHHNHQGNQQRQTTETPDVELFVPARDVIGLGVLPEPAVTSRRNNHKNGSGGGRGSNGRGDGGRGEGKRRKNGLRAQQTTSGPLTDDDDAETGSTTTTGATIIANQSFGSDVINGADVRLHHIDTDKIMTSSPVAEPDHVIYDVTYAPCDDCGEIDTDDVAAVDDVDDDDVINDRDVTTATTSSCQCDVQVCAGCAGFVVSDPCRCCSECGSSNSNNNNNDASISQQPISSDDNNNRSNNVSLPAPTPFIVSASQEQYHRAINACNDMVCPHNKVCLLNIQGLPMCRCPSVYHCRGVERRPLCTSDGQTFKNRCLLKVEECATNRRLRVLHRGQCERPRAAATDINTSAAGTRDSRRAEGRNREADVLLDRVPPLQREDRPNRGRHQRKFKKWRM